MTQPFFQAHFHKPPDLNAPLAGQDHPYTAYMFELSLNCWVARLKPKFAPFHKDCQGSYYIAIANSTNVCSCCCHRRN